jgi:phosphatidate cytidylyltransferase
LALGLGGLLLLGIHEFWRVNRGAALRMRLEIPAVVGLALLASLTGATAGDVSMGRIHAAEVLFGLALTLLFVAAALGEVAGGQVEKASTATALTVLAGVYISFPLAYMILLRRLPGGAGTYYFFFLTVVTWANDTFAYFGGLLLGRHHLAPAISPHKTIEGSICGLIASILAALIFAKFLSHSPWVSMGLGLVLGLLGQGGDLFESLLKRDLGVKDSGAFLPGHGGMLDRFDSLLLAAPALYYIAAYLIV